MGFEPVDTGDKLGASDSAPLEVFVTNEVTYPGPSAPDEKLAFATNAKFEVVILSVRGVQKPAHPATMHRLANMLKTIIRFNEVRNIMVLDARISILAASRWLRMSSMRRPFPERNMTLQSHVILQSHGPTRSNKD